MADPFVRSPLRRAAEIDAYTDAEQSLRDYAFSSPFVRSTQQAINVDVAGAHREEALEAQVRGDSAAQRAAEYNRASALRRMELETVGPTTWGGARESGNYSDYVQNVLGSAVGSMAKPIVGGAVGGLGGPIGSALGAFSGAYSAIRNAELEGYANDAQLSTLAPEGQLAATRKSALLQAAPEALLPAYIGAGGRLPGALARIPTPARIAGAVAGEAGTEGLQSYIGQKVAQSEFPDRQIDWGDVKENAIAGAIAGGALGVLGRHEGLPAQQQQPSQEPPAAAADPAPPQGPVDPNVPLLPAPETLGSRAEDIYASMSERFGPAAQEFSGKAKDFASEVMDRANEAIKNSETPQDFIRQVFRPNAEAQAAADLRPDADDPGILEAADPAAAMQQRDLDRASRAAGFAEELLADPATPQMIRDRIGAMGGDFSAAGNQAYVASTYVAVKGGQKIVDAIGSLSDFAKSAFDKAKTVAEDVSGKITKKNLQDIGEADIQPVVGLLAQRLGPAKAADAPKLARQLVAAANRLAPDAKITADTDKRLRTFSEAVDDEVLDAVTEASGSDGLRNAIAKIRAIPSAESDVRQANGSSFLQSMLKQPLDSGTTANLARFIDTMGLQMQGMSPARKNQVLGTLASAFGSKREAQVVVEYYGNMKREAFRREAEAGGGADDRPTNDKSPGEAVASLEDTDGKINYGGEFGSLTERDAEEMTASYRDPNPARPFFRGTDRAALRTARREAPAGSRVATLREFVAQSEESPQFVAARLRSDLRKRLTDAENRDTATVQEAITSMESVPEEERSDDYKALLAQLKGRKTENRTDLPGLRKQLAAIEKASGVSFKDIADLNRRVRRAELADEGGIDNDDIAELPKLKAELAKLEDRYSKNADKVLEKYAVVMRPKDETHANDNLVAKFRGILDKLPNANVGTPEQRAKKRDDIAKIKKTAIKFSRKGGKTPITLSAESMAYASQARGNMEERFLDSLAAVLARPDIDGMIGPSADTLISRTTGLTWGDISRERVEDTRTAEEKANDRKAAAENESVAEWAKRARAKADFENRAGLMKALRALQRDFLSERLGKEVPENTTLSDMVALFPAHRRKDMRTEANELAFQMSLGWAQQLNSKLAGAQKRDFRDESRMRVLGTYLRGQVEDRFPLAEGDDRVSQKVAQQDSDAGLYADEDGVGGDIADLEADIDVYEDRIEALPGVPRITNVYVEEVAQLEDRIDRLADSVGSPERREFRTPGPRTEKTLEQRGNEAVAGVSAQRGGSAPRRAAPATPARVVLPKTSRYAAKDQAKSDRANKFIGRGAPGSSTAAYAMAWGDRANVGEYSPEDSVFISVNGNRPGALSPPWAEIKKAMSAGATLITDVLADRNRSFNSGERVVADFLDDNGYFEESPGTWVRGHDIDNATGQKRYTPLGKQNRQTAVGGSRKPPNAKEHAELKKKLVEEIRRIRGNDVRVRFNRLIKHIGASGEFTMNADKTDRLIEVAVNAADPLGVAWHESLHDFFAMLNEDKVGRSIKRDLTQAADAPHVKKRLRELLKGHPKALEQIEKSPEERVAYMYQFWAAGELQLGPTGTGIFEQLRQFFRDLLHVVGRDERAADLLTALHEGKFADPSVVAEVLADMPRDRVFNRMERTAPALTDALQKMAAVAPDRLRAYQNEHLDRLADMFSSESGELGFVQRRFRRDGEWTNKLAGVLAGTTATERRAALDNMQAMKPPSSKLEKELATFFRQMHEYMTEAGVQTLDSETKKWVPLRQVTNYFPRNFEREKILKDRSGFRALLMKHGGMTAKAAENTINALTQGTGQLDLAENEKALGFSPYAKAVQDRQLTFIKPSNAADFAKYQSKDLADITTMYVKQAVHRAEYARMFGNSGEKIAEMIGNSGITDKKELEDVSNIVQGLEGTLGYEMSAATKELMSGVMTLQNVVLLPLAIFSQMIDPVVLAARSGELRDVGNAYMTAIKRLGKNKADGEDLAEMLGIVSQDTVLDAMGVAYGTTHMSKRMRNINRVFFKYNGMQGWNNSMRIAATAAGERYILQNRNNKDALAELGLEPSDIKTKQSYVGKQTVVNGKTTGRERLIVSDPKVKEAMFRFVDQAVLRPSSSNRPVWMSDPKFLLLAHLKQFTFAMHNVVLKRANQQLNEGNPKPWGILMLAMPTILAADMAKFALTGGPPPGWGAMDFIVHAVERSGLLGLGDFGAQALNSAERGKLPGEELLGPSFENLADILRWMGGAPGVDAGDVIDRTVPGARFI